MVAIEDAERVAVPCSLLELVLVTLRWVGQSTKELVSVTLRASAGVIERLVREEHIEHPTVGA